jgi:hypothetical protein
MENVATMNLSVGTADGPYRHGIISSESSKVSAYVTIIKDYQSAVRDSNFGILRNVDSMLQRAPTPGDYVFGEKCLMLLSKLCGLFPPCYQNGSCSPRLNAQRLDHICFRHIRISPITLPFGHIVVWLAQWSGA